MITEDNLVTQLVKIALSTNVSSFFVNGPPGSGKSAVINKLATRLPDELPRSFAFGPYVADATTRKSVGQHFLDDCIAAGFVDKPPLAFPDGQDLITAWLRFLEHAYVHRDQRFIVLIDLPTANRPNIEDIASLFSSARYLENRLASQQLRVCHVFTGYWNPSELSRYYRNAGISFPYTLGHNYCVWQGIEMEGIHSFVKVRRLDQVAQLHSRLLFEITRGHPAASGDILVRLKNVPLSFSAILAATTDAARCGPTSDTLVSIWQQLPAESLGLIGELVHRRHVACNPSSEAVECLVTAGIAKVITMGAKSYINFASWYMEMLTRLRARELGIPEESLDTVQLGEMIPEVRQLNLDAYNIINDIENKVRNFVVLYYDHDPTRTDHFLKGRIVKPNRESGAMEDALERAVSWRQRSERRGMPVSLNPLITYCSMRDLANLVDEIGHELDSHSWRRVSSALISLSGVRDAVMHNQLIDESVLNDLYGLQVDLYEALDSTSLED